MGAAGSSKRGSATSLWHTGQCHSFARWADAPIDVGLLRGHGDLDRIRIREVATLVNSVRNNGPELIAPAEPDNQPVGLF